MLLQFAAGNISFGSSWKFFLLSAVNLRLQVLLLQQVILVFYQSTKRRNEVVTSVVVTHSDLGEGEASNPPGHFDMVHTAF